MMGLRQKRGFQLPFGFAPWRVMLVGAVVIWACTVSAAVKAECELRVGWDDWPPYITYQGGHFRGLEYDLLKATADAAGCKLDFQKVPWARALLMLKARKLDLLYGAGYSAERAEFAKFSVPYRQEGFVLVAKSTTAGKAGPISLDSWIRTQNSSNARRRLGLFRGDFYGKKIERILADNKANVTLIKVNKNEQMVNMLRLDRLDAFIVEEGVAQMLIKGASFPMQRFLIEEQEADPLHYMFSLGISDDVVKRFNKAIQMRESKQEQQ